MQRTPQLHAKFCVRGHLAEQEAPKRSTAELLRVISKQGRCLRDAEAKALGNTMLALSPSQGDHSVDTDACNKQIAFVYYRTNWMEQMDESDTTLNR